MTDVLLDAVRTYTDAHADTAGIARTPIPGVTLVRSVAVGELQYGIQKPLIALVVQGTKEVTMGSTRLAFSAGDTLLITADVPTVSQVTQASRSAPYLSFILDLDAAVIADLSADMKVVPITASTAVTHQPTDEEVAATALRLIRLFERPASVPVLQAQLVREMHYWLLTGRHGPAIRNLGFPDSQASRIGAAVQVIRSAFAEPLRVERLAAVAGMSLSTFHHHFRAVTSLSPLQFQKQLRLIEARRLMLAESASPSHAAYVVGYESVPQFTREYRRLFGMPPAKEVEAARQRSQLAA